MDVKTVFGALELCYNKPSKPINPIVRPMADGIVSLSFDGIKFAQMGPEGLQAILSQVSPEVADYVLRRINVYTTDD